MRLSTTIYSFLLLKKVCVCQSINHFNFCKTQYCNKHCLKGAEKIKITVTSIKNINNVNNNKNTNNSSNNVCVCALTIVQCVSQKLKPLVGLMQFLFHFFTRWNSTLSMVSRYLRNQEAVNTTLAQQKHNLATLTNLECVKLQKLEDVLEPCRYVPFCRSLTHIHTLSHTCTPHLSFSLPPVIHSALPLCHTTLSLSHSCTQFFSLL